MKVVYHSGTGFRGTKRSQHHLQFSMYYLNRYAKDKYNKADLEMGLIMNKKVMCIPDIILDDKHVVEVAIPFVNGMISGSSIMLTRYQKLFNLQLKEIFVPFLNEEPPEDCCEILTNKIVKRIERISIKDFESLGILPPSKEFEI